MEGRVYKLSLLLYSSLINNYSRKEKLMNRAKAERVLKEIEKQFHVYIEAGYPRPNLRDHTHEEMPEGSWSIDWEDGPDEWCYRFSTKVSGVHTEPIFSFVLGLYDADKY
jgi:hypothetical protein